jgi:flagella basal body P-ring formation protein FlgA
MTMLARIIRPFAAALLVSTFAATSFAADLDDQLRLNTSITVKDDSIRLSDIFAGYLSRPEKIVANAPQPGQRMTLTADWLRDLAHKNGLDWQPANTYDRAVVYQPGQVITAQEILAAVKKELVAKGMPANFSVGTQLTFTQMTVSMNAAIEIGVREAVYDAGTHGYSAVVEIPPGDPKAQFIPMRGIAYPVVTVPVVKENIQKNTLITASMLTTIELPEDQVKPSTVMDAGSLIGKAPKAFLKSGHAVFENDVAQMSLVEVPVLTTDAQRNDIITKNQVHYITLNADDLPRDAVMEAAELFGRNPRRTLLAGTPIRRGDVQIVKEIRVPVLARDLPRNATITEGDLNFVTMNEGDVPAQTVLDAGEIVGRLTKRAVNAGQGLRGYDIARAIAVARGKVVTIIFSAPMIKLTAQGQATENGGVGDVIRVLNLKSNVTVTAQVIDAHTVRIISQQQVASR